jgi:hypothetical protein
MNPIADIKRFVLRALARTGGIPMPGDSLDAAVNQAVVPRPLHSDVSQAKRELEQDGFIQGARDDMDRELITWTLTAKGEHKARQLG